MTQLNSELSIRRPHLAQTGLEGSAQVAAFACVSCVSPSDVSAGRQLGAGCAAGRVAIMSRTAAASQDATSKVTVNKKPATRMLPTQASARAT